MRKPADEYLEKASHLNKEETERLLARTRSKLMRRLEDKKMSVQEVVAIQLEIEDQELKEWRERMAEIRNIGVRSFLLPSSHRLQAVKPPAPA